MLPARRRTDSPRAPAAPTPTGPGKRRASPGLLLCAALALLAAPGCGPEAPPPTEHPNLVVVLIDTLRPDHLGHRGYDRDTSPFLDQLARESTIFEQVQAASSWTAPATAAVFTGLYPNRSGVIHGLNIQIRRTGDLAGDGTVALRPLPRDVASLPEVFQAAGYATFGVACNPNISTEMGFDRGFDEFAYIQNLDGRVMVETLDPWMERIAASDPSFVYLHFMDPHMPYNERKPVYDDFAPVGGDREAAYDSEIHYLDQLLRSVVRRLTAKGPTLVAVLSDHGEGFGEHGYEGHPFSLHSDLTQVLFMVHGPELGVPARRLPTQSVSAVDVLPTLMDLAGLPPDESRDGRSLKPLLRADAPDPRFERFLDERPIYAHRAFEDQEIWAVRRGRHKLIVEGDSRLLYDLLDDPTEQHDLSAEQPELLADLQAQLEAFIATSTRLGGPLERVPIDAARLEKLKQLGYVGEEGG